MHVKRPLALLVVLLAAHFVVVLRHHARPLITDELYYIAKARYFAEHGRLPRADASELDVVAGRVWGTSDWRPQGYSLFLALVGGDDAALRLRVTIIQFLLLAALIVAVFLRLPRGHWIAAVLFGLSPWPFEFANDIGPDAINSFLAGTALLLAWHWAVTPARGRGWLFLAMLVASSTLLFRPEMIAMAPVIAFVALVLRRGSNWRDAATALLAFALVAGLQVTYRTSFTGQPGLFGALRIRNAGAFAWTRTWLGTEKEAYDFVYAVSEGRVEGVPSRAFADEEERAIVERVARLAQQQGYTEEVDRMFSQLAEKRRREHPQFVWAIRALNIVQVWFHLETNAPILAALTPVPRPIRRPILGALLLLKIAAVLLGMIGGYRAMVRWRRGEVDAIDALTLTMFAYVIARTLLVSVVLDWRVHRYVSSAWVPMLWCAAMALNPTPTRPKPSSVREVSADADRSAIGDAASG